MTSHATLETNLRAGVYATVEHADKAVHRLQEAGFSTDEISVLCSDVTKERLFKQFEHQDPAGSHTTRATAVGGAIGAMLAGLTVVIATAATGGTALLAAGGLAAWTGGIVGGLVGAMSTRGVEKELANYYNQAVLEGKLLVAVEVHSPEVARQQQRLKIAEQIFHETGAEPIALPEG